MIRTSMWINSQMFVTDMHVLASMFVEFSDDDGDIGVYLIRWKATMLHRIIRDSIDASTRDTAFHPVIYVYCINTGSPAAGAQCSRF